MGRIAKFETPPMVGLPGHVVAFSIDYMAKHGLDTSVRTLSDKVKDAFGTDHDHTAFTPLLKSSRFRALVDAAIDARLFGEGKQVAVTYLISLAKDDKAQPQHRLRAAELILSRTMAPAAADASDPADLDLSEMSPDDLRGVIAATQSELQTRAKQVGAPVDASNVEASEAPKANSLFD